MKILFFIGSLESGGAERVATTLCNHWSSVGDYEVFLASGEDIKKDFYEVANEVIRISFNFNYNKTGLFNHFKESFSRYVKFSNFLREINPDIVILSCTDVAIRHSINFALNRYKLVICEHNNYYAVSSKFKRILRNIVYTRANNIVLLTNRDIYNYPFFLKKLSNLSVINNPCSFPILKNNIRNVPSKRLLAIGRLTKQKAFHRLLDIMLLLPDEFELDIFGEGDLRENLQNKIDTYGLNSRVRLAGNAKNISDEYVSHSLLLMTSIYEGLPMVIIEANSFGMPVIAYNCPTGPEEMIEDGINGFLIDDGNSENFASKILDVFSSNDLYLKLVDGSLSKSDKYSIDSINSEWTKIFKNDLIGLR